MIPSRQADAGGDSRLRRPAWAILLALLPVMLLVLLLLTIPNAVAAVQEPGEVLAMAPSLGPSLAPAVLQAPAQTNTLNTLEVVNARDADGLVKGEPIGIPYRFQIVQDNTGDPFDTEDCWAYDPPTSTLEIDRNPNYPDGCEWPGVHLSLIHI